MALKDLPTIDAVLVSHDHYDHLCCPTVRALAKTRIPFITSLGVGAHLQAWDIAPERITELDWWQSHRLPGTEVEVTAAPSQHFSGRGLKDRNATLWSGLVVRGPKHRVFFSGDTGLTDQYSAVRERLGPFDLVMHAWDEPVETLLKLAPQQGVQLLLPQLGQVIEPVQVDSVVPWWRGIESRAALAAPPEPRTWPKAAAWPMD